MEYVSIPRAAMAARWRPISHAPAVQPQQWRPAPAQMSAPPPTRRLGQIHPLSVADVALDSLASFGTMAVGFAFALWGPKDAPTWRWLGGLIGTIGTMRALHNVSKLGL
jgi:hypothetical protein